MSWSPDGTKIAFQDSTDIFTINIDGSNRINLTNGQFFNTNLRGRRTVRVSLLPVLFILTDITHRFTQWIKTARTGQELPIANSIAKTGRRFGHRTAEKLQLTITTKMMPTLHWSILMEQMCNTLPLALSQSGRLTERRSFLTALHIPNLVSQIWVMNRDGSGLSQLTNASPNNFHPDWQPLVPTVNVATLEELYSAVNNPQQRRQPNCYCARRLYALRQ